MKTHGIKAGRIKISITTNDITKVLIENGSFKNM
jgi:hypothetical protein